jgi:hypothetical protein
MTGKRQAERTSEHFYTTSKRLSALKQKVFSQVNTKGWARIKKPNKTINSPISGHAAKDAYLQDGQNMPEDIS